MNLEYNIDEIILQKIGKEGFFVDAGASHPIEQNNTNLLELNGWRGIAIEPLTNFNNLYTELRPNTILENYVLVNKDYKENYIAGDFSYDMMSGVINIHKFKNWNPVNYPCITLDKLLNKHNISNVTLLSLDVEGYEKEVLGGIDFNEVFFDVLVIEKHGARQNLSFLENFNFEKKISKRKVIQYIDGRLLFIYHEFYVNKSSKFFNEF